MKYTIILIVLFAFNSYANSSDDANANRLFVSLIQDEKESFLVLQDNLSPKKMTSKQLQNSIVVMEDTVQVLQEIVDNYPGSSLAVQIATGQKVGWFFPNEPYEKLVEMKFEHGVRKCAVTYKQSCMVELVEMLGLRVESAEDKARYDGVRAAMYFKLERFSQAEAILKDIDFEQLHRRAIENLAILAAKFLSQQQAEQIFEKLPKTIYQQKGYAKLLRNIAGGSFKTDGSDIYDIMKDLDPMEHFNEESYYKMMVESALIMRNTTDAIYYITKLNSEKTRKSMQSKLAIYYAERDMFEEALGLVTQLDMGSYGRQRVVYLFSSKFTSQEVPQNVIEIIIEESSYSISKDKSRSRRAWHKIIQELPVTPSLIPVQEKLIADLPLVILDRAQTFLPIGITPKYKEGHSKDEYVSMIKKRVDATDYSNADKNYTIAEVCFTIRHDECAVKYLEKTLSNLLYAYAERDYYQYARGFTMARLLKQKQLAKEFLDVFLRRSIKAEGATKPASSITGFMDFSERGELF